MYCPRCNLHSEEYIDKCPLCAGSMEVDELGSGLMKTPAMPEKESTEAFPKEESLEFNEDDFTEGTDKNAVPRLELEQEKIIEEATQQLPDKEPVDAESAPPLQEEESLFDQKEQLYEQKIPRQSEGKKSSSRSLGVGIVLILVLLGAGYFYFFQSEGSSLIQKVKLALNKKQTTSPQSVVSSQAPAAEEKKGTPETVPPQPEAATPPAVTEKTDEVSPTRTEAEESNMTKQSAPPQESQETVVSSKPPKIPVAKPESQKAEAPPVASAPATPQEKPKTAKASKSVLSKTKEITLPAPVPQGKYSLMVGAFKVEQNALSLQNKLRGKGYPVRSCLVDVPGKGSLHRVIVGDYADLQETRTVASKLKSEEKLPALIMKDGKYL